MAKEINNIRKYLAKNRIFITGILLSFILAFTPVYGLSYILLSITFATRLNVLHAFRSYFANFIVTLLIVLSSIMVSGIFTSIVNIPNFASLNLVFALVFCGVIYHFQQGKDKPRKIFDLSDSISLTVAVIVPIIIVGLQIFTAPTDVALFKLANADGWDNVSHLNMLQTVSENHNYFYSTSPMVNGGEKAYNNYPQGWHIASSNLVNGVMPGVFNPDKYGLNVTLGAYIATSFIWFILAVFVFAKVVLQLAPTIKKNGSRRLHALSFSITMILPILALFVTTISSGYINYLGLIPLIILIVAASYQLLEARDKRGIWVYLAFTLPLVAGVCLMWVLPTPALMLLMVATVLVVGIRVRDYIRTPLIVLVTSLIFASLIGYLYILTQDVSLDQISINTTWLEHFPTATLVFACLAILALYVIVRKVKYNNLVIVLSSFMVYIFAVWMFSYISGDKLGYYHAKLFGLSFVVVALFTCAVLVRFIESIDTVSLTKFTAVSLTIVVSLSTVSTLLIVTGVNIDGRSFQRSQHYLGDDERIFVAKWMASNESLKDDGQLLLMRENILDNKNKAMLYNRVTLDSARRFLASSSPSSTKYIDSMYTCILNIYYEQRAGATVVIKDKNKVLNNLSTCLGERNRAGLPTTIRAPRSIQSELEKIDTYNAHIVYYDKL